MVHLQSVRRLGKVAYRLELPPGSRIHDVFHVSLLKLYKGRDTVHCQPLPTLGRENQPLSFPLAIIATRELLSHAKPKRQILVQWSGVSADNSTWEDLEEFKKLYPAFQLEDKLTFDGGRNDTNPISLLDPTHELDQYVAQQ